MKYIESIDGKDFLVEIDLDNRVTVNGKPVDVDLKRIGRRAVVIEVNDNPNIDAGNEDKILKDALYREIMGLMLRRIIARKRLEFDIP